METAEIPPNSSKFAERLKIIGRKVMESIGDRLITVPPGNRETPSFLRHKNELTAKIDSDVDVSPQRRSI
jgi:hypothetical protein